MTNDQYIPLLHPKIRDMVKEFLNLLLEAGIEVKITCGMRTFEQQDALYNQTCDGKDNDGDGKIDEADEKVTNAKAGQSFHNYGLAIDVVPIINGKAIWDIKNPVWQKIAQIGREVGFQWGGDWTGFKDYPHFEFPKATSWKVLYNIKKAGKIDKDGYVLL